MENKQWTKFLDFWSNLRCTIVKTPEPVVILILSTMLRNYKFEEKVLYLPKNADISKI